MNCIREAENYLRYYRELHQRIKDADNMISRLKWQGIPNTDIVAHMDVTGIRASKPQNTLNPRYINCKNGRKCEREQWWR
ncbi:MAG: hypothetical protein ABFD50_03495 [Smithella sp.]